MTPADRYAAARDTQGTTVEEWERAWGLPPFTVVPAARAARGPHEDGWFMYGDRAAVIAEEDRQMKCLRALGLTLHAIAALYGMSFCRVHKRINGWRS